MFRPVSSSAIRIYQISISKFLPHSILQFGVPDYGRTARNMYYVYMYMKISTVVIDGVFLHFQNCYVRSESSHGYSQRNITFLPAIIKLLITVCP
jgi:hypothetical protein